jgi:hypothetical protein
MFFIIINGIAELNNLIKHGRIKCLLVRTEESVTRPDQLLRVGAERVDRLPVAPLL